MRIMTYRRNGSERLGFIAGDMVVDPGLVVTNDSRNGPSSSTPSVSSNRVKPDAVQRKG
jgi:hypothetical protein